MVASSDHCYSKRPFVAKQRRERIASAKAPAVKSEAHNGGGCLSAVALAKAEGPAKQTDKC